MKKLIWLLLLAATSMWAQNTNYNPGTTAIILSAVTTTGTGTCYAMLNQGAIPANFTWQTVIAGGTASSITVVFEGSLNSDCSNPSTIDTSTSTSGETRSVANKAYPYITANITAYSRNGTTATVNFVAQYGSGVPTPSAPNLCFVSQGAVQGSWTWKACSGAGGTLTSFSSGDLTGLFTTSVATATSTPALSFTAANFSAHTFWGNNTGSTAAGSAVQPSVSDLTSGALANGTTATTQSTGDTSTNVATDQFVANAITSAPMWLRWQGDGSDGAISCTSTISGEKWATTFTVANGNTCTCNSSIAGCVIRATGACTIAGTFNSRGVDTSQTASGLWGGSGGGSGGGAAGGAAGASTAYGGIQTSGSGLGLGNGGTAGTSSGGNGGNGAVPSAAAQKAMLSQGLTADTGYSGADGAVGGSSGGAKGHGAPGVILVCASIDGTGGVIDATGGYGTPPAANSTGAGSAGGGGVVILSTHTLTAAPTIYVNGGQGGPVAVPAAQMTSGAGCTTIPVLTLGLSGGALNTCTVGTAGAGCVGTPAFTPVGGGGTNGTITPTMSGGAVASCTATGGSGYTAATYTTAGTGGNGGNGWTKTFTF